MSRGPLTKCQICACTYLRACGNGCSWVADRGGKALCSVCADFIDELARYERVANTVTAASLARALALAKAEYCQLCHGSGKVDRGNGSTKPCTCVAGLIERNRRKRPRAKGAGAMKDAHCGR